MAESHKGRVVRKNVMVAFGESTPPVNAQANAANS
jgi:hypothetical protein